MVEDVGLVDDEKIVSDCEKWIFVGDNISTGKRNDQVFHNACQVTSLNKMINRDVITQIIET